MKSYEERFASMLKPGARATDVQALIAETEDLLTASQDALATAKATAGNPNIADEAARVAQDEATGHTFAVERLIAKLERLGSRLERITQSDQAKVQAIEYESAAEEHGDLVDEITERVPALFAELVDLLGRIESSDARIEAANKIRPGGKPWLLSAELVARKAGGHHWPPGNVVPVDRFTKIKLPRFETWGFCWPTARPDPWAAVQAADDRQWRAYEATKQPEAKAAAAARKEAQWARYRLSHYQGFGIGGIAHRHGVVAMDNGECFLEMNSVQVDRARAKGIDVELAPIDAEIYE